MNSESILQFTFDYIDTDGDEKINTNDIIRIMQYKNPKTEQPIFFTNFIREVEAFKFKDK